LRLTPKRCASTVIRLDGGLGTDDNINWLLSHEFLLLAKGYNGRRAHKLATQLTGTAWQRLDARHEFAIIETAVRYARRTQTIALRSLTDKDEWHHALLIHNLFDWTPSAIVKAYQTRARMENEIKSDKCGLWLPRRRKKHFEAQEAMIVLTDIAHNLLAWLQAWGINQTCLSELGALRMTQDVFRMPGYLEFKGTRLVKVALPKSHPYAPAMLDALRLLARNIS
jgi:hypothetical protein